MAKKVMTSLYVDGSLIDRADALIAHVSKGLAPILGGGVKRAVVLRIALEKGLKCMEKEVAEDEQRTA